MFLHTMNHVSVDIETLGTDGAPVILSIGAVRFNPLGNGMAADEWEDTFYKTISIGSSLRAGLEINGESLHWWMKQSEEARQLAFAGENSLEYALHEFYRWSTTRVVGRGTGIETPAEWDEGYLWGFSAAFDCSHIETACRLAKVGMPFDFRHQLCLRTIARTAFPEGIDYAYYKTAYPRHHALGDAIVQARILQDSLQRLGVRG